MAARWRMPPDSCAGRACSNPCRPTSSISSSTRRSCPRPVRPVACRARRTLARTERHGSRAGSWNAIPRWCSRRATDGGSPCTRTVPAVGVSRSARMRSTVDLPQPDGPTSAVRLPAGATRSTWSMATSSRRRSGKTLRSPLISNPLITSALTSPAVSTLMPSNDRSRGRGTRRRRCRRGRTGSARRRRRGALTPRPGPSGAASSPAVRSPSPIEPNSSTSGW